MQKFIDITYHYKNEEEYLWVKLWVLDQNLWVFVGKKYHICGQHREQK